MWAIQGVMGERARFVSFHGRVAELVEQLVEQTSEDKKLARRARDLENRLAEQSRLLEASECERKQLREEIDAALKTEAERRNAVITEIDNHAKAENAKLRAALDRASGDRTRLAYELATAKRQAQLLKAGDSRTVLLPRDCRSVHREAEPQSPAKAGSCRRVCAARPRRRR